MVDAHALGACGANRAGSNPASPTNPYNNLTEANATLDTCATRPNLLTSMS